MIYRSSVDPHWSWITNERRQSVFILLIMSFVYELPYAVCNGRVYGVATLNSALPTSSGIVTC